MNNHDTMHGFKLLRQKELPELAGMLYEYEHTVTGLKLVWLKRPDDNKTFGITFTTLPWDDTGVFHILEHSVLGGSKRYPVKEPFVELLKSSMNTFLNAMTFPDKTMYPVSSRNSKDFLNLVRVYLDAVFCPSIYVKPEIFYQEGWHYEFDEAGNPSYKGVVFNEMKGAFADADELMDNAMSIAMFPDTPYRYVSGGDPAKIPDLTYENFVDGHRKYYSPSNAYVFLDGDLDLEAVLTIMQDEYLCGMSASERIAPPAVQKPVDGGVCEVEYELSAEEEPEGKTRLCWGRVICDFDDRERLMAASVLSEALCGSNQAPLTRAVLEQGLAENVSMSIRDAVSQPWLCLEARNLREEDLEKTQQVICETLEMLATEGLDREELEAILANQEFRMRERDYGSYPTGLINGMMIMESWLYGGAPEANLEVGDLFVNLRRRMQEGWFEQLLRELLLENPHGCTVIMKPSHTAGDARRQLEKDRLQRESSLWTPDEKKALLARQEQLLAWQNSTDTPEQLATLPHLLLSDLADTPEQLPMEKTELAGMPVLLHQVNAGGIVYLSMYFDADGCSEDELSTLSYLCVLLGETHTGKSSAEQLIRRTRLLCGDLHFAMSTHRDQQNNGHVKLVVTLSALEEKLSAAVDLALEILTGTLLDEEDTALELLKQSRQQQMEGIIMGGSGYALKRVSAMYSAAGVADECLGGFAVYQWMKKQETEWNWETLSARMLGLLRRTVCRAGLTLSFTGEIGACAEKTAEQIAACLPAEGGRGSSVLAPWGIRREGILIPADIGFAVRGGNFLQQHAEYTGAMLAASKILSLAYLWNVIRVQGGAYGAGFAARTSGLTFCHSYRDPNPAGSLQAYLKCGDFLREFCASGTDFSGYIIGAVSDASPLMTPRSRGSNADSLYWQGVTWEQRCRRRRELLATSSEDLRKLSEIIDCTLESGAVCVVGGQQQLDDCALDTVMSI